MTTAAVSRRELLRASDVAKLAGVSRPAVGKAFKGKLKPALTEGGSRVYANHPLVLAYIANREGHRRPGQRALLTPKPRVRRVPKSPTGADDPFAVARVHTITPVTSVAPELVLEPEPQFVEADLEAYRRERTNETLYGLYLQSAGQFPKDINDLGATTLRVLVDEFGTLPVLADAVKALKYFAEMKVKEVDAAKKRGELVDRKLLSVVLVPLAELSYRRLVTESPDALAERIIARVLSGGDDLRMDVVNLIREENSGALESMVESMVDELKVMEAEADT